MNLYPKKSPLIPSIHHIETLLLLFQSFVQERKALQPEKKVGKKRVPEPRNPHLRRLGAIQF